jgi:hypothetical protein
MYLTMKKAYIEKMNIQRIELDSIQSTSEILCENSVYLIHYRQIQTQ